jgi:hypothetical protein
VARQQEVWAEAQRERARQAREREHERCESQRAQARAARAADWAERDRKLLAADERVRKIFYIEDRMAEAAAMAADVRARLAELDGVLKAGSVTGRSSPSPRSGGPTASRRSTRAGSARR